MFLTKTFYFKLKPNLFLHTCVQAPFPCNLSEARPEDKKYCLRKEERTAVEENFIHPVSKYSQSQTRTSKLTSQLDNRVRTTLH